MARSTMALVVLAGLHLVSYIPNYTIALLKPVCVSQFALANQACAVLPVAIVSEEQNITMIQANDGEGSNNDDEDDDGDDSEDNDNDSDDDDDDGDGDDDNDDQDSQRRQRTGRGHGHRERGGRGNQNHHGRQHGHRHRRGHRHGDPRAYRDCCRWVNEVDKFCVCDALLSLPPFLIKPWHRYFIKVGSTCKRAFVCRGF